MADPRVERLASVLVNYSTRIQPGDFVAIFGSPEADSLIREVYRAVMRAGGFPYSFVSLPGLSEIFFSEANQEQLTHVSRIQDMVRREFDALIGIQSDSNTRALSNVAAERQAENQKAYSDLMQVFMTRGASGELKWVGTLFPTNAYAQDADMSLEDFEDYVL